jgi:mono/diheme cytochrome c family protein
MKRKSLISIVLLFAGMFVFTMITGFQDKNSWVAPDADNKKVNPIKSDASSLADGKELWVKHCQSCHGKTGKGDGTKAAQLKTEPGDFTKATTQSQTTGSLFYKTSQGRGDMPDFKKKISENDDIWSL